MPTRSRDSSQLLPPGLSDLESPYSGDYQICWSIYVRCSNRRKLRELHIPALNASIGEPHGPILWNYLREDYLYKSAADPDFPEKDPNLHRIVAIESVKGPFSDHLIVGFMRRLYALAPSWRIEARLDVLRPHGVYVMAHHVTSQPRHEAPAIEDLLVEFEADLGKLVGGSRYVGAKRLKRG